ncbi:MAG: diacylglycerol kinase [bacterium]
MPLRRWVEKLNNAINGVLHAAKTERHLRYHFYSAAAVLISSFVLGISPSDFMIIAILASIVILAEMINTAIEHTVDLLSPEKQESAKYAKDIAAGAVLITAFTSAVIGYMILLPYVKKAFFEGIRIMKYPPEDIIIVSIIFVLILVILLKTHFGGGKPLWGGLPSGHAALSFSLWVAVTWTTRSFIASLLSFILAASIAQSRVAIRVHTPLEVIIGSLLGSAVTLVLFLIFT